MAPDDLKANIKNAARESGFAAVGIASVHPSRHASFLRSWLNNGYGASMKWMERHFEKRTHPGKLVAGARSVISLADAYKMKEDPKGEQIARYAQGLDYHRILKDRLHALFEQIKKWAPGTKGRVFVDSAPVLEHYWAEQAGVGWIGKNSLVITKKAGSFVYLGEIICDLRLPADEPAENHCGTCTACMDACPTTAIVEPYVVDANKCIAYLSIEHKGAFSKEQEEMLGEHLLGCDICLDACPWNHKIEHFKHADYGWIDPAAVEADVANSPNSLDKKYGQTAIMRPGKTGLERNLRAVTKNRKKSSRFKN